MYQITSKFLSDGHRETVCKDCISEAVKAFNKSEADVVELVDGSTAEVLVLKDGRGIRWNELDIV